MVAERSLDRLPLRQILSQASRLAHDIAEIANKTFQNRLNDLHELSRPARKKSHFPTVVALQNGVAHYGESSKELLDLLKSLDEHLQAIREQANRARIERG